MLRIYKSILIFLSFALLAGCSNEYPRAVIITENATIVIELYPDKAPVTVKNFMQYCAEGRFKNSSFYRAVRDDNQAGSKYKIQVLQGGLKEDYHPLMLPPIVHETTLQTGILHTSGIISMARNEPGSATSEFFICLGNNPELDYGGKRNPDGQGFAAFGRVIQGMDAVERYWQMPADGQYLNPPVKILDIILVD